MAITSLSIRKTAEIGYAKEIGISFKRIRITTSQTTTIPDSYGKSGATAASAGTANTTQATSGTAASGASGGGSGGDSSGETNSSILYSAAQNLNLIS